MNERKLRSDLLTGGVIGLDCRQLASQLLLDQPQIAPIIDWLAQLGLAVVKCPHCHQGGVWSGVYTDRGIPISVGRVTHWVPVSAQAMSSLKLLALPEFEAIERCLSTLPVFQAGVTVAPFCAVHADSNPLPAVAPVGDGEQFPYGDCPDVWTCNPTTIPIPTPSRERRTHLPGCH